MRPPTAALASFSMSVRVKGFCGSDKSWPLSWRTARELLGVEGTAAGLIISFFPYGSAAAVLE